MPAPVPADALGTLAARIEALGLRHMLTGSAAGMFYGLSCSTVDPDIVLDLAREQVAAFVEAFAADSYVEPFDRAAFARRRRVAWRGGTVWVISPPDLVISKLCWARLTHSDRQIADVRAILASGLVAKDDDFRDWIARLDLRELLDASRAARHDA